MHIVDRVQKNQVRIIVTIHHIHFYPSLLFLDSFGQSCTELKHRHRRKILPNKMVVVIILDRLHLLAKVAAPRPLELSESC